MYIGTTGPDGVFHLIREIVDNGVDEAMAGYASRIDVTINADGSVAVTDNGRGIPVDSHASTGKSAVETVMTTLHAGGKFGGKSYQVSGGLHGVGASVVNALSEWARRRGATRRPCVPPGIPPGAAPGRPGSASERSGRPARGPARLFRGCRTRTIFEEITYDWDQIANRFREMAYLNRGLAIHLRSLWHEEEALALQRRHLLLRRRGRELRAFPQPAPKTRSTTTSSWPRAYRTTSWSRLPSSTTPRS